MWKEDFLRCSVNRTSQDYKRQIKKTTFSTISTGRLNTLQCLHRPPINLVIYKGYHPFGSISNLGDGFPLRCFQRLSVGNLATQRCSYSETTDTPGIPSSQSSRTRDESLQISTVVLDRDRAVLRRSEPSSRTALTGEQPDPWELLHPQDAMSRHREFWFSITINCSIRIAYPLVTKRLDYTFIFSITKRASLIMVTINFCFFKQRVYHPI